jgi:hypothetical protein
MISSHSKRLCRALLDSLKTDSETGSQPDWTEIHPKERAVLQAAIKAIEEDGTHDREDQRPGDDPGQAH